MEKPAPYASDDPATRDFINEFAYTTETTLFVALERADHACRANWSRRSEAARESLMRAVARRLRFERERIAGIVTLEWAKRRS